MSQNTQRMLQPAAIGGACLGVASQIPIINFLNCACCALVIGGGMLSAYLYMKELPPSPQPPYGDGVLLGVIAGAIGAVVSTLLSIPLQLILGSLGFGLGGGLEQLREALEEADVPEGVLTLLSSFTAGGLTLVALVVGFVFNLVIYVIFAAIGALIGVAVFNKKPALAG